MLKKKKIFNLLFVLGIGVFMLQFTSTAHAENELPGLGVTTFNVQENTYSLLDF
ncbi:hypothetical protein [Solibacillus daqui]|uniref:hypothetical protein n=1 Tax=Solibacillus daqui TaxID=2912187 RepID=UPI002366C6EE|nr:hypothetical protein [Solibacillus daqui]